jgi:hypothetical protein
MADTVDAFSLWPGEIIALGVVLIGIGVQRRRTHSGVAGP